MVECPHCGTSNRNGSRFCSNCGRRLELITEGETAVPSTRPPEGAAADEEGEPEHPGAQTESRPELPEWLYRRSDGQATEAQPSPNQISVPNADESNRYLKGIQGVLPDETGWLGSALSDHLADEAEE
jgi:hypothetical protein